MVSEIVFRLVIYDNALENVNVGPPTASCHNHHHITL